MKDGSKMLNDGINLIQLTIDHIINIKIIIRKLVLCVTLSIVVTLLQHFRKTYQNG